MVSEHSQFAHPLVSSTTYHASMSSDCYSDSLCVPRRSVCGQSSSPTPAGAGRSAVWCEEELMESEHVPGPVSHVNTEMAGPLCCSKFRTLAPLRSPSDGVQFRHPSQRQNHGSLTVRFSNGDVCRRCVGRVLF